MNSQQPPIQPGKPLPIEEHLEIIRQTIIVGGKLGQEVEGIVAVAYRRPQDLDALVPDLTLFNTRPDRQNFAAAILHHGTMMFHESNLRMNVPTVPATAIFIPSDRDIT